MASSSSEQLGHDTNQNRSSIDISMELERQLGDFGDTGDTRYSLTKEQRLSLDPNVLAIIVIQLRESLDSLNHEKKDLVRQLTESHSRIAEFKDTISLLTERCSTLESDLGASQKKVRDDEEAISLLRSKVEESRQGLMRLQSERNAENSSKQKRMTLDLNATRASWNSPRSANRASFTPITGSGITGMPSNLSRRSPSISVNENDPCYAAFVASLPNSPMEGNDRASRRRSNIFGPSSSERISPGRISPAFVEMESMKYELATVKAELEETRHELLESNEAREASEICLKALRDYISQLGPDNNNTFTTSMSPVKTNISKGDSKSSKASGWNLNLLWGPTTDHSIDMAGMKPRTASVTSARSATSDDQNVLAQTVPRRNKFGSLFTRGTSVSSTSTHPLSSEFNHDEPILNGSDVSSITSNAETSAPSSPPAAEKNPSVYIYREAEEDTPVSSDKNRSVGSEKIP